MSSAKKQISAGVVVLNEYREVLLAHVTGQPQWDILKGGIDEGETPEQAALREAAEESGLMFSKEDLIEIGQVSYTKKKDLHLFIVRVQKSTIDLSKLVCTTFVEAEVPFPEMDDYKWVPYEELMSHCAKSMGPLLVSLLSCH